MEDKLRNTNQVSYQWQSRCRSVEEARDETVAQKEAEVVAKATEVAVKEAEVATAKEAVQDLVRQLGGERAKNAELTATLQTVKTSCESHIATLEEKLRASDANAEAATNALEVLGGRVEAIEADTPLRVQLQQAAAAIMTLERRLQVRTMAEDTG